MKEYVRPPRTHSPGELLRYRETMCQLVNAAYGNRSNEIHAAVTTTYTITDNDFFLPCNGTFTITLPTAVGRSGYAFIIKNIGTGLITVDGNGSETIDDQTSIILSQYDSAQVVSDGTEWWII